MHDAVASINAGLPDDTQIRRFALLFKELDADDGELTRTRKVRRTVVSERYGELIEGLYDGTDAVNLTACIQYQDGRTREMCGTMKIMTVADAAGQGA